MDTASSIWTWELRLKRRSVARFAVCGLVVAGLLLAYKTGVLFHFSSRAEAQKTLLGLGGWGFVAFVLAYAVLQPFGIPGTLFIFVAPLIWPFGTAFLLSTTGTMAASVVGFSLVRFVARDWLSSKIPARFAKYNDALEKHSFLTVVLLRMVFWMSLALHTFLGLSKVPFWTHFFGSLVGYLPILLAASYFGPSLLDFMRGLSWPGLLVAVLIVVALVLWRLWATRGDTRP